MLIFLMFSEKRWFEFQTHQRLCYVYLDAYKIVQKITYDNDWQKKNLLYNLRFPFWSIKQKIFDKQTNNCTRFALFKNN